MRRIDHQRRITARLLLSVFVPMLLLASLHHHGALTDVENTCVQCEHHQPHDGHMSSQSVSLHDCVLCQFTTLPFLRVSDVTVAVVSHVKAVAVVSLSQEVVVGAVSAHAGRAPPYRF